MFRSYFQGSTLKKENLVVRGSLYLLPGLALSGLITWPLDLDHLMMIQALFLLHTFLGLLFLPFTALYLLLHFVRTLGNRSFSVFFSGIAAGVLLIASAGSGTWLALQGQTETTRWILDVHIYSTLVLLLVTAVHLVVYLRQRREKKRKTTAWPSLNNMRLRRAGIASGAQLTLAVLIALGLGIDPAEEYKTVPGDYSQTYGEHPLRPSETEIRGGSLVKTRAIAGSEECGDCHRDIAEQWKSSAHRKAALDPAYERNVNLLAEKKGIEATRYCEGCHAPIALLTGELTPGGKHGGIDDTPGNDEGISCKSCHSISRVIHTKGVASYEYAPPAPYLFEHRENMLGRALNHLLIRVKPELHRATFAVEKVRTPEFCATCHAQFMDKDMNDWGWVKMQDEYQGWLKSPWSGRNDASFRTAQTATCQDCHMKAAPSADPSAASHGQIKGHDFAAANTFIPLTTGDHAHFEKVRDFLTANRMRLSIDVADNPNVSQSKIHLEEKLRSRQTPPDYYYLGQTVEADILVSNIGVGHQFPGGTTDINEAWLAIQVTDASGREIYRSGDIQKDGHVDPDAYFYKSIKVDRHGREVWKHDLFNMVGEHYKNVIPAGETDSVPVSFKVPWWATSPVTVSAQLNYRKFNQRYASWVMKDPNFRLPVVVMANTAVTLPVHKRPHAQATGDLGDKE